MLLSRLRRSLPLFAVLFLLPSVSVRAQDPASVDIDLRHSELDSNTMDVYLRANGASFGDIVSGLTFTFRWPTTSTATLGPRVNSCPDGIGISATAMVVDPLVNDVPTGFNYRSYNAFGIELLSEWGCDLPADTWYLVMSIPVENNTGCTEFNIVNDNWTDSPGNARDYYLSLGGLDRTGIIEPVPVLIGECTAPDCEGTAGGKALPGTPCDDVNALTENDTWTAECLCAGEFSTGIAADAVGATFAVWPNPTTGLVSIRANEAEGLFRANLSDALGRPVNASVARSAKGTGFLTLDLTELPTGVYLLEFTAKGAHRVERIVKR